MISNQKKNTRKSTPFSANFSILFFFLHFCLFFICESSSSFQLQMKSNRNVCNKTFSLETHRRRRLPAAAICFTIFLSFASRRLILTALSLRFLSFFHFFFHQRQDESFRFQLTHLRLRMISKTFGSLLSHRREILLGFVCHSSDVFQCQWFAHWCIDKVLSVDRNAAKHPKSRKWKKCAAKNSHK